MKKQTQKKRPAKGAKNTDRAAVILSLFREFPNNKFSLKHLASASGGATKEGRRETFEILGRLHDEGIVEECAREKYRLTHKHLPHFEGVADMTATGSIYVRVEGEEKDIFLLALDPHVDGPRGRHVRHAFEVGQVLVREAVFLACALLDDAFVVQPSQNFECFAAPLFRGASRGRSQVFEREFIVGELPEKAQDDCRSVGVLRTLCRALFLCLLFHFFRICRARRFMKPMPTLIAPSSGLNVAVWGRPAAAPTPSR